VAVLVLGVIVLDVWSRRHGG